jgi:hypothetical protein
MAHAFAILASPGPTARSSALAASATLAQGRASALQKAIVSASRAGIALNIRLLR